MIEHELRSGRPLPGAERTGSGFVLRWRGTAVMGILNVTPDSFSDGGLRNGVREAVEHARAMAAAGAMVIDVGGESTRPGAEPVSADVEAQRVLPVIRAIAAEIPVIVSVDTYKPEIASEALREGAHVVNDIRGLRDPAMLRTCASAGAPAVAMHMRGEPRTMQEAPAYGDVVAEVGDFLREARDRATEAGVPGVIIDPGIGFGKSLEHNLALLRAVPELVQAGVPVLVGASRKGLIASLTGAGAARDRDAGSVALHLFAAAKGAAMVRVHDVPGHVQALRVWERLHA